MLDWGKYIAVADRFQHKAKWQDRKDLRQDIILRLAQVARNNGHKPFTDRAMIRVASYVVADDKAIDLDAWLDDKTFSFGFPKWLLAIGYKIRYGIPLTNAEMKYLCKWRKRQQKKLL